MTAAKTVAVAEVEIAEERAGGGRGEIRVDNLRVAPWNARKTFDARSLDELTISIQKQGLLVPLIVRPFAKKCYARPGIEGEGGTVWYLACKNSVGNENIVKTFSHRSPAQNRADAEKAAAEENGPGDFEIVAGHRRYRAVFKLNWQTVTCIVRNLTDDEAREIGLVDNLQREDVPALEEADAYNELKQRLGTAAAIAARVGKDVAYVARRLQLVSLAELPRKALAERLITVDHALLLARLGPDEQDVNLKWALNPNSGIKEAVETTIAQRIQERDRDGRYGYWEPQSVLDLKNHIEQNVGRKLKRAPWDLDDATLLKDVPTCNACPSNTKANDTLFGDLAIEDATCEDGGCYEAKRAAFVQIQMTDAGKPGDGHLVPVRISFRATTVKPRWAKDWNGPSLAQTFKHGQWIEAKPKSCEHIRLGVTVDWSDDANRGYMGTGGKVRKPGQVLLVCVNDKCKAHRKEWEKPKSDSGTGSRNENSAEAKAKREQQEVDAKIENAARAKHVTAAIDGVTKLSGNLLRSIVLRAFPRWLDADDLKMFPGLKKALETAKVDSVEFARAAACVLFVGDSGRAFFLNPWDEKVKRGREELVACLKDLGYDASKAFDPPKLAAPSQRGKASLAVTETLAAKPAKKSILSPEAKKRIAAAQKKRWAAAKKKGGRK